MTAPAHYAGYGDEDRYATRDFFPGERIGAPLRGRGRKAVLRGGLLLLILSGGGWAAMSNHATWPGWLWSEISAALPALERRAQELVRWDSLDSTSKIPSDNTEAEAKSAPLDPPQSGLQQLAAKNIADAPSVAGTPAAPPLAKDSTSQVATADEDGPAAPLPPPAFDHADPYQKRAVAVGLHPDLSRVLLARLSPTDYRNAGIAIGTAVAKTSDTEVFVWPRDRKPELALFQVHFVPGAAPDCRRYVVTVTKDGWLTTALPMEKCGTKPGRPRRG